MGRKWTIKIVKESFEVEEYDLLTTEYINNHQKLNYICPNGHRHSITWMKWRIGRRCPYCYGNVKQTIEFIRSEFEKEGYKLITTEYINNKQKLEYICPEGHRHTISWDSWSRGRRCQYCANTVKLTVEFIREEFKKEGYILLTNIYEANYQKLYFICPKGHKHFMDWKSWSIGIRCPYCAGNAKLDIKSIKKIFEKEKYVLLTTKYINSESKLEYICPEGHRYNISWNNWNAGHRCPECARLNNRGCNHSNWKGGISKEPYCQDWGKDLKEFVKERDGYKCMNPDCWGKDKTLSVHHIDYNKKSCGPENLITVCRSCNTRANKDREWHEDWYKAILHRRYNYIY